MQGYPKNIVIFAETYFLGYEFKDILKKQTVLDTFGVDFIYDFGICLPFVIVPKIIHTSWQIAYGSRFFGLYR